MVIVFFLIFVFSSISTHFKFRYRYDGPCTGLPTSVDIFIAPNGTCYDIIDKNETETTSSFTCHKNMINETVWISNSTVPRELKCKISMKLPGYPKITEKKCAAYESGQAKYTCEKGFYDLHDNFEGVSMWLAIFKFKDCEDKYPFLPYITAFPIDKCFQGEDGRYYLIEGFSKTQWSLSNYTDDKCTKAGTWTSYVGMRDIVDGICFDEHLQQKEIFGGFINFEEEQMIGKGFVKFGVLTKDAICFKKDVGDTKYFFAHDNRNDQLSPDRGGQVYYDCDILGKYYKPPNYFSDSPYEFSVGFMFLLFWACDMVYVIILLLCCFSCLCVCCVGWSVPTNLRKRRREKDGAGTGKKIKIKYSQFEDEDDGRDAVFDDDGHSKVERQMEKDLRMDEFSGMANTSKSSFEDVKKKNSVSSGSETETEETESDGEHLDEGGESMSSSNDEDDSLEDEVKKKNVNKNQKSKPRHSWEFDESPNKEIPSIQDDQGEVVARTADYTDEYYTGELKEEQNVNLDDVRFENEVVGEEGSDLRVLDTSKTNILLKILNFFFSIIRFFLKILKVFRSKNGFISILASCCLTIPTYLFFCNLCCCGFFLLMAIISFAAGWKF